MLEWFSVWHPEPWSPIDVIAVGVGGGCLGYALVAAWFDMLDARRETRRETAWLAFLRRDTDRHLANLYARAGASRTPDTDPASQLDAAMAGADAWFSPDATARSRESGSDVAVGASRECRPTLRVVRGDRQSDYLSTSIVRKG